MIIKSKGLISYFESRIINSKTIIDKSCHITLNFDQGPIDLDEVFLLINSFPDIKSISIISEDFELIRNTLISFPKNKISKVIICPSGNFELKAEELKAFPELKLLKVVGKSKSKCYLKKLEVPKSVKAIFISNFEEIDDIDLSQNSNNPTIQLNMVRKKLIYSLDSKIASLIQTINFDINDRTIDTIMIGDILKKFPNLSLINYPPYLDRNVSELGEITELLKICGILDMSSDLMKKYKQYYDENNVEQECVVYLGKSQAITKLYLEKHKKYIPAMQLRSLEDCSKYLEMSQDEEICIGVQNMSDLSLEIAKELKRIGVKCKIFFNSHDNTSTQNSTYTLDEYISIYEKMNELIGDISTDLPEQERFAKIYRRIVGYIEYDYAAGYPSTVFEKKYSDSNSAKCRNLINGLLLGKCVCAGYADILKNACLLKGIECEFVVGPIDTIKSKLDQDLLRKNEEIIYTHDADIVTREYHAWNKVKINGVWYNCDPTWDKPEISRGEIPKYALISDDLMMKMGRPTSRLERCPCDRTATVAEKKEIFPDLEPSGQIVTKQKLIDFEKTLDEYGNPKQLPIVKKRTFLDNLLLKIKRFARCTKDTFLNLISSIKDKSKKIDTGDKVFEEDDIIISDENLNSNPWQLSKEEQQYSKNIRTHADKKKQEDIGER